MTQQEWGLADVRRRHACKYQYSTQIPHSNSDDEKKKKDRIRTSGNIFLLRTAAAAAVEGWREEEGGGDIGMSQLSCGWNPQGGGQISSYILYSTVQYS